jgi:hypothetical protein
MLSPTVKKITREIDVVMVKGSLTAISLHSVIVQIDDLVESEDRF